MAFKPTETETKSDLYDLFSPLEQDSNQEQFINDVFNDEYLLVVGSEVILDKKIEPTGDVNRYILSVINQISGKNYNDFNDLEQHKEKESHPIRKLLTEVAKKTGFHFELTDISPELKALLETKLFPVVLTTTFDNYLETLMRYIWGDQLNVVNIYDKKSLDKLRDKLKKSLVLINDEWKYTYNEPTLIYIFGKAVKDEKKKFVHTDDIAIQTIEKWMEFNKKNDQILRLFRERKALALGCKFENWYFRFFWYILKRDISRLGEGQVAFMLDCKKPIEKKLDLFLKHSKIFRHPDARKFMTQATQMMSVASPDNPYMDLIMKKRQEGGIFLSYCSENVIMASKLFFKLDELGYKVWFDNKKLKGGDNFDIEISNAIAQAKVFVPLLTPSIAQDLQNGNYEEKYYVEEWRMAKQFGEKKIIPLAVDGYDVRADYHTSIFQGIINDKPSGVNLMTTDGFNKLLSSIDKELAKKDGYHGQKDKK